MKVGMYGFIPGHLPQKGVPILCHEVHILMSWLNDYSKGLSLAIIQEPDVPFVMLLSPKSGVCRWFFPILLQ